MSTKAVQCRDTVSYYSAMRDAAEKFRELHRGKATSANRESLLEARRAFHDAATVVVRVFFYAKVAKLKDKRRDLDIEYGLEIGKEDENLHDEDYMAHIGRLEEIRERGDFLSIEERHYEERFRKYL